jgi:hypothetical protein
VTQREKELAAEVIRLTTVLEDVCKERDRLRSAVALIKDGHPDALSVIEMAERGRLSS